MKNPKLFFIFTAAALFLAGLLVFSRQIPGFAAASSGFRHELRLISDVAALIQKNYVEETSSQKVLAGALNGMLTALDPYSQYLSKDAYEELRQDAHGEFGGIGVEVAMRGSLLRVVAPLDDSPAERAGLRPGDAIIKIDEAATRDMTLNDAVKKMKGRPGSTVRLSLIHEQESKLSEVAVVREVIHVRSIKEAKLLPDGTGYIRLSAFQENSKADLERALASLEAQGMRGLILDLRNNAGGLFTAAIEAAELFIPEGRLIVSTKGRMADKNRNYFSSAKKVRSISPFVVIVNKGSASSSEILAGALQEHKLATVLGAKTFGKGSIQSLIPLQDGAAIRMTTSRYVTPGGREIHEQGIVPDVEVEAPDTKEAPDAQLERAISTVKELKGSAVAA